jgi:hypothetical protein
MYALMLRAQPDRVKHRFEMLRPIGKRLVTFWLNCCISPSDNVSTLEVTLNGTACWQVAGAVGIHRQRNRVSLQLGQSDTASGWKQSLCLTYDPHPQPER